MNQIYVDIADEKKEQIQNDNIQLEINESQDIKITENTSEHKIVQIESEAQSKNKNCDFCNLLGVLSEIKTLKQSYFLCDNCSEFIITYQNNKLYKYGSKLVKKITIDVPQGLMPYDIKRGQCPICEQNQILYQIGKCNHYFCHPCINNHISLNLENSQKRYKITCLSCDNLIDDYCQLYVIYEILPIDHLIKPKMCCIKKHCELIVQLEPYMEFKATSIKIDNEKASCNICSKQFCALCWNSHKGGCNYEKNFKDSLKKLGIVRCPRCNCPGQSEPCIQENDNCFKGYVCQDQFCPLCGYKFCKECLGPVQMYESVENISGYSCYKCKRNFYKWINVISRFISGSCIQKIGLFILYLAVIAFLILGCIVLSGVLVVVFSFQHGVNVAKDVCRFHMRYYSKIPAGLQQTFSPFLLCCLLVSFIIVYVVTFIPSLMIYIRQNLIQN